MSIDAVAFVADGQDLAQGSSLPEVPKTAREFVPGGTKCLALPDP